MLEERQGPSTCKELPTAVSSAKSAIHMWCSLMTVWWGSEDSSSACWQFWDTSAFLLCFPGFGASVCCTLPPWVQLSVKKGCLHWDCTPNAALSCLVCFTLQSPFPHTGTAASTVNSSWCSQGSLNALKCFSAGDCEHLLCHNPSCVWQG